MCIRDSYNSAHKRVNNNVNLRYDWNESADNNDTAIHVSDPYIASHKRLIKKLAGLLALFHRTAIPSQTPVSYTHLPTSTAIIRRGNRKL